jgi:hypothetical protein
MCFYVIHLFTCRLKEGCDKDKFTNGISSPQKHLETSSWQLKIEWNEWKKVGPKEKKGNYNEEVWPSP